MESPQVLASLDRLRETQIQVHSEINRHGELLHDLVDLQRQVVHLQQETARVLMSIRRDKASSHQDKSLKLSKPIASDVLQWVAAAVMVSWVIRGEDPAVLLKVLAPLLGG